MPRVFVLLLAFGGCLPVLPVEGSSGRAPSLERLDRVVHVEANAARRSNGIPALDWSRDLAAVAERHSREMARTGRFDHTDAQGGGAFERLQRAEIVCQSVGENLYTSTRYESVRRSRAGSETDWFSPRELARNTIVGWLESPGHRRNLLDRGFRRQGVGVAERGDRVYVTQVLC